MREVRARGALAESHGTDNADRELVFYYADRTSKPEAALALAEREISRRGDVFTREALAWALYRNGKLEAARSEIEPALAPGIRNARMLYRAGVICAAAGDGKAAVRYLEELLAANPLSPVASEARERLEAPRAGAFPVTWRARSGHDAAALRRFSPRTASFS